jgi:hypothetical protein
MMASPLPLELQEIIYGLAVASVDGISGTTAKGIGNMLRGLLFLNALFV